VGVAETLYGAWLELAGAGLVAIAVSLVRLRDLHARDEWRAAREATESGPVCVLALFGVPMVIGLLAVLSNTRVAFDASKAPGLAGGIAIVAFVAFLGNALARRVSVRIDGTRDLVVEVRGFVFPPRRCVVPMEIVRGIRLEERRAAHGSSWDLIADLDPAGRVVLLTWTDEAEARRIHAAVAAACGARLT